LRILLAEDNAVNQKVALGQLRKLGHSADAVANGLEVLESIQRIPYDVVLIDCQMPEMDGFEATGRIREREKREQLEHLHIIALTAHAMAGDRQKCLDAGMDDYLSKPVRLQELQKALQRYCSTHPDHLANTAAQTPQPDVASEPPPVDMERLDEAADGNQEQMRELVDLYLAQADEILSGLDTAIKTGATKDVERLAHKLAGASLACGMTGVANPLRELERQGKEGRLSDPEQPLASANRQLAATRRVLEERLRNLRVS
jgi:CheY-like chemotaxis protein